MIYLVMAVVLPIAAFSAMVGIGGLLFLLGSTYHYIKDAYHERRTDRG